MKSYDFRDTIHWGSERRLRVDNAAGEQVGLIGRGSLEGCERKNTFAYWPEGGREPYLLGIRKRGITDLLAVSYALTGPGSAGSFRDKSGNSLLYFCVTGMLDGVEVRIEENWDEELEIKTAGRLTALIKQEGFSLRTALQIDEAAEENSSLFALSLMAVFMFNVYKKESAFIEELLFN
ncbi:hypothetical protein [Saccharibacillus alkalitolerans]|uniref:Uncharacterized protein n=1 Tax=Saccharibacillus alkalitolerans TaxID=2705290 RepID=A0ABX0F2Z1_9BACL|nr:hypothetical protein [Saccharibacillus alkalitolerans]NGZ75286.1 hypothetical protein [Saccharibacillus alkalitolerans]